MPRKRKSKRPHGQGTVYEKNDKFTIAWREGGKRKYLHGFKSEEDARAALGRIVNTVDQGQPGIPELAPEPPSVATLATLATDWLERRKGTHRAAADDANRWKNHLAPAFGATEPNAVDAAAIRKFIEDKLRHKLSPNTIGNCVRLLSTFYTDLVERGLAKVNPVSALPRATRRLYRPSHDPKDTPFLRTLDDIRRVYLALAEPVSVAFAIGALAGLRTGEVLALEWGDVDLDARRIHVQRQVRHGKVGPLKDSESRIVPLQNALAPILKAWKLKTGGSGLILRPTPGRGGRPGSAPRFVQIHTLHKKLAAALSSEPLKDLPKDLTWYQSTRHTYASQWVLEGGSIERLRDLLGHESVLTTERYAHLKPGHFADADFGRLAVDLSRPAGSVTSIAVPGAVGYQMATDKGAKRGSQSKANSRS